MYSLQISGALEAAKGSGIGEGVAGAGSASRTAAAIAQTRIDAFVHARITSDVVNVLEACTEARGGNHHWRVISV